MIGPMGLRWVRWKPDLPDWPLDLVSAPVEVDPAHGDRLRVRFQQGLGDLDLEVAVFKRDCLCWFAVAADQADLGPERAGGIEGVVFHLILPETRGFVAALTGD